MNIRDFFRLHETHNGREPSDPRMRRLATDTWPPLRLRADVGVTIAGADYEAEYNEGVSLQMHLVLRTPKSDGPFGRMFDVTLPIEFLEPAVDGTT